MFRFGPVVLAAALAAGADFTYTEKSEITGGALKKIMDMAGRFGGQRSGPTTTVHRYQGDKMSMESEKTVQIHDLQAGTVTAVDHGKKEFSVITFAELGEAMAKMADQMGAARGQSSSDVKAEWRARVETPGDTRQVAGLAAKHAIMKVEMEVSEAQRGKMATTRIDMDMWMAEIPGDEARREFQKKMAGRLMMASGPQMMALAQAGGAGWKGMAEAAKKLSEIPGIPVRSTARMGNDGMIAPPPGSGSGQGAQPPPPEAQPQQPQQPSVRDAVVGGIFGGLGRRRKQAPQQEQAPPGSAPPPAAGSADGVLLEFTTEVVSYSSAPVDSSAFAVPAGYKQVEHPLRRHLKK